MERKALTTTQVSVILGVTVRKAYQLMTSGRFPVFHIDRCLRVWDRDLYAYIDSLMTWQREETEEEEA